MDIVIWKLLCLLHMKNEVDEDRKNSATILQHLLLLTTPHHLEEVRVETLAVVVRPLDGAAHAGRQTLHLDADT